MNAPRKLLAGSVVVLVLATAWFTLPDIALRVRHELHAGEGEAERSLAGARDLSSAFKTVARVVKPSVVHISSVKVVRTGSSSGELPFGLPRGFLDNLPQDHTRSGQGSGVIVSEEGHILTNNHVVDGADELTVTLWNDEQHTAEVIGTDPRTDLALLKVDARGLQPARLGDSDSVEVGEWVLAMGSPFGLTQSLTAGIVSAKGRNVGVVNYENFIQTDAAVNPGNSGGPLVNLDGEVVGINTLIFSRSGGYQGISFAIPINMANDVKTSLLRDGKVTRGYLGVLPQDLNKRLARTFGYSGSEGVVVAQVIDGEPASRAGFKEGDILVEVDGARIESARALREKVAALEPGSTVEMRVFRDGEYRTLEVEIGELPGEVVAEGRPDASTDLGMSVRTLTGDQARRLRLDEGLRGVIVTQVKPLGAADKAGLDVNDIIVSVQGRAVDTVSAFRKELAKHDLKAGVRLKVRRGERNIFLFLEEK